MSDDEKLEALLTLTWQHQQKERREPELEERAERSEPPAKSNQPPDDQSPAIRHSHQPERFIRHMGQ
jgi:hypothetical protein